MELVQIPMKYVQLCVSTVYHIAWYTIVYIVMPPGGA